MIDDSNMNRIIGEYMEINSDIISAEFQSKYPKFISRYIANKQREKLLASIEKFRDSDYILTWFNLIEYFTFVYNRYYDDERSYKSIIKVAINQLVSESQLEAVIKFDKILCTIFFDSIPDETDAEYIKFNLVMRDQAINREATSSINVYIDKLQFNSERNGYMVERLNQVLKDDICDFIIDMINDHNKEL